MSEGTYKNHIYVSVEELIYVLDTLVVKYGDKRNDDVEYGIAKTISAIHEKLPEISTYCFDEPLERVEYWGVSPKDSSLKTLCELADKYNIEITIDGSLGR